LRSIERLLQQQLPSATFGKLVAIRNAGVTAIVCGQANPSRGLMKLLRRLGFRRRTDGGWGAGIGVSRDVTDISQVPTALEEAHLALEFVTPENPVLRFDDIDLTEFLIRRAERNALKLIPEWASRLAGPETPQASQLAKTIHAFADCSLSVKETARRLNLHPNTVYFRLNQIQKLTGTNPRSFAGLSLLLTALRLLNIQQQGNPAGG
jgi:DNA-binding PucR family transcriptional regulator